MGGAVKKKDDTHKMAEANKAFCALPLVSIKCHVIVRKEEENFGKTIFFAKYKKYRYYGSH